MGVFRSFCVLGRKSNTMIEMKRTLSLLVLLVGLTAQAQERRWHFEMDLRYQHMFFYNYKYEMSSMHYDEATETYVDDGITTYRGHQTIFDNGYPQKYGGNALVLMETYDINRRLTAGLGLEWARYNQLDASGLNIVASLRYRPWTQHARDYWYTELGFGMLNLGWGTSVKLSARRRLDFKVGYDLQRVHSETIFSWKDWKTMHCLQASVGVVF